MYSPGAQGAREVFGDIGLVSGATVITAKGTAELSDRSETHELLTNILVELKIMNRHLVFITDEQFAEEDVDDRN